MNLNGREAEQECLSLILAPGNILTDFAFQTINYCAGLKFFLPRAALSLY